MNGLEDDQYIFMEMFFLFVYLFFFFFFACSRSILQTEC